MLHTYFNTIRPVFDLYSKFSESSVAKTIESAVLTEIINTAVKKGTGVKQEKTRILTVQDVVNAITFSLAANLSDVRVQSIAVIPVIVSSANVLNVKANVQLNSRLGETYTVRSHGLVYAFGAVVVAWLQNHPGALTYDLAYNFVRNNYTLIAIPNDISYVTYDKKNNTLAMNTTLIKNLLSDDEFIMFDLVKDNARTKTTLEEITSLNIPSQLVKPVCNSQVQPALQHIRVIESSAATRKNVPTTAAAYAYFLSAAKFWNECPPETLKGINYRLQQHAALNTYMYYEIALPAQSTEQIKQVAQ